MTESIYWERLEKLAVSLFEISYEIWYTEPQNIVFYDQETHTGFEATYFRWVFEETVGLFWGWKYRGERGFFFEGEWHYVNDLPVYHMANRDQGTVWSALFFFGLNEEEFIHLFGFGKGMQQPDKYGGWIYEVASETTGRHICLNIMCLIKKKKMEKIYRERLLYFADYLHGQQEPKEKPIASIEMLDYINGEPIKTNIRALMWIFNELPNVFVDDWFEEAVTGEPIINPPAGSGIGTIESVFIFFGLKTAENFKKLFAVNDRLSEKATYREIAECIVAFVRE